MKNGIIGVMAVGIIAAALAAGFFLGRGASPPSSAGGQAASRRGEVWTCSMHPQVRLPAAGSCPICSMPLTLVADEAGDPSGALVLQLSDAAVAMAGIETSLVTRRPLLHEIRAVGRIEPNETSLATVTTRVEGWVEKLFVDATGVQVAKGDHLLEIYSPELISDQNELLIALRTDAGPDVLRAAKSRLERWGMGPEEIELLFKTRKALETVTIHAPSAGTVLEKSVVAGAYVERGNTLYRLADLGSVWIYLDIYEYDIAWVQPGEEVEVTAEAWPGRSFNGTVTFVSPVLDESTRTIRVRVALPNADRLLKPGMFVSTALHVRILRDGSAARTTRAGKWTCPMHPEVLESAPGQCPKCKMDLTRFPGEGTAPDEKDLQVLAAPATAILDAGGRTLAYVERAPGKFEQREVVVGARTGDWFPVISGLMEGERVATRGGFLIDSQFQIRGMKSLIQSGGGAAPGSVSPGMGEGSEGSHKDMPDPGK